MESGRKRAGTWYQCPTCRILLHEVTRFLNHLDRHGDQGKCQDEVPKRTLFHTTLGLQEFNDLPAGVNIFVPKIRLTPMELMNENCRVDIYIPNIIIHPVDDLVQINTNITSFGSHATDVEENNVAASSTQPGQKITVQQRRTFRGNCWYCGNALGWLTMKTHITKCPKRPQFCCTECCKPFPTAVTLEAHVELYHINEKKYRCQVCEKPFPTLRAVKKHMRNTFCKTKFISASQPPAHGSRSEGQESKELETVIKEESNHSNVEQGPTCPHCGRTFVLKEGFFMKTHLPKCKKRREPIFPCLYSCPANFKSAQDLADHVTLFHRTKKQYKCELCAKPIATLEALKRHLKRTCLAKQDGSKSQGIKFWRPNNGPSVADATESNIGSQVPGLPNACGFCGKVFPSIDNLRTHLKRVCLRISALRKKESGMESQLQKIDPTGFRYQPSDSGTRQETRSRGDTINSNSNENQTNDTLYGLQEMKLRIPRVSIDYSYSSTGSEAEGDHKTNHTPQVKCGLSAESDVKSEIKMELAISTSGIIDSECKAGKIEGSVESEIVQIASAKVKLEDNFFSPKIERMDCI